MIQPQVGIGGDCSGFYFSRVAGVDGQGPVQASPPLKDLGAQLSSQGFIEHTVITGLTNSTQRLDRLRQCVHRPQWIIGVC